MDRKLEILLVEDDHTACEEMTDMILKSDDNTTQTKEQHEKRINRRISTELNNVDISPKAIGYTYLAEAISTMMNNPTQKFMYINR